MKAKMSTAAITLQPGRDLDSLIEIINKFIHHVRSSKRALHDFVENLKFCRELRIQRKVFEKHTNSTIASFGNFSEKNQVALELLYYRAVNELRALLPSAEEEIKKDYTYIISRFLLREINKTISSVSNAQQRMADMLYPNNDQEILSNPELLKEMSETWADLNDEY